MFSTHIFGLSIELTRLVFLNKKQKYVKLSQVYSDKLSQYIELNHPSFVCFSGDKLYHENRFITLFKSAKQVGASVSVDQHIYAKWLSWSEEVLSQINQIRIFLGSMHIVKQHPDTDTDLSTVKQTIISLRKRYKNTIVLVLPVHKGTINFVHPVAKLAEATGNFCNFLPVPRYYNPELSLSVKQFWEFAERVDSLRAASSKIIVDLPIAGSVHHHLQGICPGGRIFFHVDVAGKIKICPYCFWIVGSLDENDIKTIIEKLSQNRSLGPACQSCSNRNICGGGCWANRLTPEQPDFYCIITDTAVKGVA